MKSQGSPEKRSWTEFPGPSLASASLKVALLGSQWAWSRAGTEKRVPSRTSGRTGMGTRDLTSSGKIEEWAPDLFAAIGVCKSGILLWGDLVPSVGPSFGAWRESSMVTIGQVQKRIRAGLPWHLVFSNKYYNGYNDHLGESLHACVLSILFCSSPAIHYTCDPPAMLGCPSTLILIAELRSK